jgi:hypothetical protein
MSNPNADPILARVNSQNGADLIQVVAPGTGVSWRLNNFQNVWYSGTGSPVTAGVTGMVTGSLYVDTSSGNVWQYSGTAWAQIPGTGSQIYSEVGIAGFREDFISGGTLLTTASTTPSVIAFDTPWIVQAIGNPSTAGVATGTLGLPNVGTVDLNVSPASSGDGMLMTNNVAGSLGDLAFTLSGQINWQMDFIMQSPEGPTQECIRMGLCATSEGANDPPADGMWVRYDEAQGDTLFTWECRAGGTSTTSTANSIAVNSRYHHFRIRSLVAGTILFSVDGGLETAISTNNVPDAPMLVFIQLLSRANTSNVAQMNVDFVSFTIATGRT